MPEARIGLIAEPARHPGTGVGRYTRELAHGLGRRLPRGTRLVLVSTETSFPAPPGAEWRVVPAPTLPGTRGPGFPGGTHLWYARLAPHLADLDLVHNPSGIPTPFRLHRREIATIHDLSPILAPRTHRIAKRILYRAILPRALRRAALVLAISEATRQALVDPAGAVRLPPDRVRVTHLAAGAGFRHVEDPAVLARVRARYRLPDDRFVLGLGPIEPRKNLASLVRAMPLLRARGIEARLVIAGREQRGAGGLRREIARAGLDPARVLVGYVEEEDIAALYSLSSLVAYPSLHEGFALPALEAAACGTPVLCPAGPPYEETLGEARLTIRAEDPLDIAEKIAAVLGEPALAVRLGREGAIRAKAFTWDRCSAITREAYEELLRL